MLDGTLDDLKIFERGLEQNEIIEEMNNHAEFYIISGKFWFLDNMSENILYQTLLNN